MIEFNEACLNDYDAFYEIKADKNNIIWGGFSSAPEKTKFHEWYNRTLEDSSNRKLYIMRVENKVVGFSSVDYTEEIPEISYGVLSDESGKGYGTEIIRQTCLAIKHSAVKAHVSEKNIGSIRCFEKNGFVKTSYSETRELALFDEPHLFYKWIKYL